MATTRKKATRKANSDPEVQYLGSREGGGAEKSAILEKEETHHSEQPRKGRGCPRKAPAVDVPTFHDDRDPTPIEDLPRKRVRNNTKPAIEDDSQPVAKRLKADQPKAGDTRKVAIIPPRDPLPDRTGRNVHPIPKKGTRRSHQDIEAEREAKTRAIEEEIQKLETAKRLLAEANAFEDTENDAMDQIPQRLSTVVQKRKHIDVVGDSDDGEHFDFKDVDEMIDTSEDEEPVKQKVVSVHLRQKAQKTPTHWKHV